MLLAFPVLIKDKFFRPIKCERKVEEGKVQYEILSLILVFIAYIPYI